MRESISSRFRSLFYRLNTHTDMPTDTHTHTHTHTPSTHPEAQSVSSVAQSCPMVCDPMDFSTPGFPVHHQLPEPTQIHGHRIGDAIQPSHPLHPLLLLSSILASIRVFSKESVLRIRWPNYWSFSFSISPSNEYSGLISLGWVGWISLQSKGLSRVFSNTTVQKHRFFGAQLSLWSNSHIQHDHWKNHSFA